MSLRQPQTQRNMLGTGRQSLLVACSVTVGMEPDGAFDLFAHRTAAWWPIGRDPHMHSRRKIILEPRPNGRFYETHANGDEKLWGNVVAYVRPRTLVINWRLNAEFAANDGATTDLEIFFAGGIDGDLHKSPLSTPHSIASEAAHPR